MWDNFSNWTRTASSASRTACAEDSSSECQCACPTVAHTCVYLCVCLQHVLEYKLRNMLYVRNEGFFIYLLIYWFWMKAILNRPWMSLRHPRQLAWSWVFQKLLLRLEEHAHCGVALSFGAKSVNEQPKAPVLPPLSENALHIGGVPQMVSNYLGLYFLCALKAIFQGPVPNT